MNIAKSTVGNIIDKFVERENYYIIIHGFVIWVLNLIFMGSF